MALATENIFNTTQSFLDPNFIQEIGKSLGQPAEKVQQGLRSVIPAFLMGLVSKGSSSEGAQSIIHLAERDGISSHSPEIMNEVGYQNKGKDALQGIFGKHLTTVTTTLGNSTGLNTVNVTKMMGLIAPIVMGVLGRKIQNEGMSSSSLMSFLGEQRKVLSGYSPMTMAARPVTSYATTDGITPHYTSRFNAWALLSLTLVAMIGFLWWWTSRSAPIIEVPVDEASLMDKVERTLPARGN